MKKTNKRPSVKHSRAHIRKLHHARVGLFSILLLALVMVRGGAGLVEATSTSETNGSVLAYSTSVSRTDLLNATNSFRAQNGLAPLSLSSQLNNSAQSKAQHMIDNNYWAHTAPDGTTPWYFFDAAGYNYSRAGENLAYGFATSQDAVNGWIASPGHRANMLGDYQDVGFGFADGANYQGGQNTVIVAHYGAPVAPPPAPAPTPAPTPAVESASSQSAPAAAAPAPSPTPASTQPSSQPTTTKPSVKKNPKKPATTPAVTVATTANVSLLDQLTIGKPRLAAAVSILLVLSVVVGFAMTHRSFVRHAAIAGERYVLAHPLVDTTVVAATIILMLSTTVGRIG